MALRKKSSWLFAFSLALCGGAAQAQTYEVLYSFDGSNGAEPSPVLIFDGNGGFYGTTDQGGTANGGTVYHLSADKTETILYSFPKGRGGCSPGGLTADAAGNLYGPVWGCGLHDEGGVFRTAPGGDTRLLYSFQGFPDGFRPNSRLALDAAGNLYGTTFFGGNASSHCPEDLGCGIVYRVAPDGSETILHAFDYGDGSDPNGPLIADGEGNFYGTTMQGGDAGTGAGTVFRVSSSGKFKTLFTADPSRGKRRGRVRYFEDGVVRDAAGNLYGVSYVLEHKQSMNCTALCAALVMLSPDRKMHVLYRFPDDAVPDAPLAIDAAGNLYGTATYTGAIECERHGHHCGTAFRYSPDGSMTILHVFHKSEGAPSGVSFGPDGKLYGVAGNDAKPANPGFIFRIDL